MLGKLTIMAENRLITERKRKLEELKKLGINPYAYRYDVKHKAKDILDNFSKYKDKNVKIAGRIMSMRGMGKVTFMHIQDSTAQIQLYFGEKQVGKDKYKILKLFDIGDVIGCQGSVFKTKKGETSVNVGKFTLLSKSLRPLPAKWHGLKDQELRYRQRDVDFIMNPKVKEIFIIRAKIYQAIREFLNKRDFMEVQTPILQTLYGGANARPFITNINAWNMDVYLRIAYEMHLKRLIVGGFDKIFDLSSCFRNEGVDKTHNPEFAMMEIQWAYADYNDMMKLTEELWEYVAKKVLGTTVINYKGKKIDLKTPWKRLTMKNALKKLAKIDVDKLSDKELYALIKKHKIDCGPKVSRGTMIIVLFEELCENKIIQPTHVIDHPKESCALAKPHRDDPELIERVEPIVNGWEVGNGYSELTDPILQREHFEEQVKMRKKGDQEAHPMDDDFVRALEQGLPPNAGMGIGIDRWVMLFTGAESIRDVTLFPVMKPDLK